MRKIAILAVLMAFLALAVGPVFAEGLIRISPHGSYYGQPVMLTSPATFNVYIQSGPDALDPHIFLIMTEECYNGLTGDVEVSWTGGDVTITAWNKETDNSVKVPLGTEQGTGYTVASLKDHLNTTGPIYWAFEPFLEGPITQTPVEFVVTLPSTAARMLVYALGKSSLTGLFDNRVPPTQPGFVVPELIPIMLMISSFGAFALYTVKRRRR